MNKDELYRINTIYNEKYFDTIIEYSNSGTFKKAWMKIEDERAEIGLPERYKSYESFRNAFMKNTHSKLKEHKKRM